MISAGQIGTVAAAQYPPSLAVAGVALSPHGDLAITIMEADDPGRVLRAFVDTERRSAGSTILTAGRLLASGDYQGLVANATGFVPFYVKTTCADGGPTTQPSCRAIQSVLNPTDRTPTGNNSTDVYAAPGS